MNAFENLDLLQVTINNLQSTIAFRDLEIMKLKCEMAKMEEEIKTLNKRIDRAFMAASNLVGGNGYEHQTETRRCTQGA